MCGINCRREEKEGKEMKGKVRAIVQVKDDKDWSGLWKTELQVVKAENNKEVSFRDTLPSQHKHCLLATHQYVHKMNATDQNQDSFCSSLCKCIHMGLLMCVFMNLPLFMS